MDSVLRCPPFDAHEGVQNKIGEAIVREWWAVWLWALGACLLAVPAASKSASPGTVSGSTFQIDMMDPAASAPSAEEVTSGALDQQFVPYDFTAARKQNRAFWLRLRAEENSTPGSVPTLNVSKGRHMQVHAFVLQNGRAAPLRTATHLPGFRGMHQIVFALPERLTTGQLLYV
jgi:hypothetical protein